MNNFWQDCLAQIKAMKLPPMIITNWFEPIELVRWDSERGDMVLEAPASKVQTIRATYLKTIQDVAVHLYGGQVKVTLQAVGALAGDVQTPAQPKGPSLEDIERRREETGLLPGLTFENYVNGNANQLAVAAAEHVATTMGMQYNPLYIYGGVGLGKTHLMQAIGHRYLDLHPKARVRCISAQDFISEYTTATRDSSSSRKALQMFDERYRNLDLLLIDDVQSFSGAKGSQAQFYRAFEALVPHNKQVVLTADTYTRNLKDIEQRLISRFSQACPSPSSRPSLKCASPFCSTRPRRSAPRCPKKWRCSSPSASSPTSASLRAPFSRSSPTSSSNRRPPRKSQSTSPSTSFATSSRSTTT